MAWNTTTAARRSCARRARRVFQVGVSALVVLVLMAELTPMAPASAAPAKPKNERIPPISSPKSKESLSRMPDQSIRHSDRFPNDPLPQNNRAVDKPESISLEAVEDVSKRTAFSDTSRNVDGSYTTRVYLDEKYMKTEKGVSEINLNLVNKNGQLVPVNSPSKISIASSATTSSLVTKSFDDGSSVSFALIGGGRSRARLLKNKAEFGTVKADVDLHFTSLPRGVKEDIVLRKASAGNRLEFALSTRGVTASTDGKTVTFTNSAGKVVGVIPQGFMSDSSATDGNGEPATSYGVEYRLTRSAGMQRLQLVLDQDWLRSPDRVYPVIVDPTVTEPKSNTDDTFYMTPYSNNYSGDPELKIGSYNGSNYTESFIHFPLPSSVTGSTVLAAQMSLYRTWSYTCGSSYPVNIWRVNQAWSGSTLTSQSRAPSYSGPAAQISAACPTWMNFDVKSLVQGWASNPSSNNGVAVTVGRDVMMNRNAWKRFASANSGAAPYLGIRWNKAPNEPTGRTPGDAIVSHSSSLKLSAKFTDPENDKLSTAFELSNASKTAIGTLNAGTISSGATSSTTFTDLAPNTVYYWRAYANDGYASRWSTYYKVTTQDEGPTVPIASSPANNSVLTTTNLSFETDASTDPEGDKIQYQFQVATGLDGVTGRLATSPWQDSTKWTPPNGTFYDGGKFYWVVRARDSFGIGNTETTSPPWSTPRGVRIDFRLGQRGTFPYDNLGGASVNLSNGNLNLSVGGPQFNSLSGSMGASFTYNSQAPVQHGLYGDYYQDLNKNAVYDVGEPRLMRRLDPQVSFDWLSGKDSGPNPGIIDDDWFLVRWTGVITAPTTGSYEFERGSGGDLINEHAKVLIGGQRVFEYDMAPSTSIGYVAPFSTAFNLVANQPAPITIWYSERTGSAKFDLMLKPAGASVSSAYKIPSDWLTPSAAVLPDGWSRTGNSFIAGYTSLRQLNGQATIVTDSDGGDHTFTYSSGGWRAPSDEDGQLTQNEDGSWSLQSDDGAIYSFTVDGVLADVTSVGDDRKSTAPTYEYRPLDTEGITTPRLTKITDVSGRSIEFIYSPNQSCPTADGFDSAAPLYMLCRIVYTGFGGADTQLLYVNGHLARVINPGGASNDFGYDDKGRLTQLRGVLTNDLIAGGVITDATSTMNMTLLTYDDQNRLTEIKAPIANANMTDAERSRRWYTYTNDANGFVSRVDVHASGLSEPNGYLRRIEINTAGHATKTTDVAGVSSEAVWNDFDEQLLRATDHHFPNDPVNGLVSTTSYDEAGRATDSYGPGAPDEFGPISEHSGGTSTTAPRSSTTYDGGIDGLAATWFNNANLRGRAVDHTTTGAVNDWGAGSPSSYVNADNFSGRLTGEINMATAGTLTATSDGARVFVDDAKVIDTFGGAYYSEILKDEPSTYYRFDDPSGSGQAVDDALSGPNAAVNGKVEFGQSSAITDAGGGSASFDGTGYVSGPSRTYGAFTVEALIKPTGSLSKYYQIYGHSGGKTNTINVRLYPTGSTLQVELVIGNGTTTWYVRGGSVPLNQWSHVAASFDGATGRVYLNGTQVGSSAFSGSYKASGEARIGQDSAGTNGFVGGLDEVAVFDSALTATRIAAHNTARTVSTPSGTSTSVTAGVHKFAIEYAELTGTAKLSLTSTASFTLKPRYSLVTKTVGPDGNEATTEYANPELGLATAATTPVGTASRQSSEVLRSSVTYEARGTGYFRQTSRTLPAGNSYRYEYYDDGSNPSSRNNPCVSGSSEANQGGAMAKRINPDPDGSGPGVSRVEEFVYDGQGRIVATRMDAEPWTCTYYDSRSRATRIEIPQLGSNAARTITNSYEQFDSSTGVRDATYSATSDNKGTISAQTDWLGRVILYSDVYRNTTTTQYDTAGRATTASPLGVTTAAYDSFNRPITSSVDGVVFVRYVYDDTSNTLARVEYPTLGLNSTALLDSRGRSKELTYQKSGDDTALYRERIQRSLGGRVVDFNVDSVDPNPSGDNYEYDGAGRLVHAFGLGHEYQYEFAANNSCGFETAGRNSNRTKKVEITSTGTTTTTYCYDQADKLTSTNDPMFQAMSYDNHGSLQSLTNNTAGTSVSYSFDQSDRHMSTTRIKAGVNRTMTYERDVTSRIISRTTPTETIKYGFTSGGDSPSFVSQNGVITERYYALGGGVMLTKRASGDVYSLSNIHGDVVVALDSQGNKVGSTAAYDPDGKILFSPVDNTAGKYDFGWLGGFQRGTDTEFGPNIIEMGARMYAPGLGRFLEVDPIEGGGSNDYTYPSDPVNGYDLDGYMFTFNLYQILLTHIFNSIFSKRSGLMLVAAHRKNARPSTRGKHQKGESRIKKDQGRSTNPNKRRNRGESKMEPIMPTPTPRDSYLRNQSNPWMPRYEVPSEDYEAQEPLDSDSFQLPGLSNNLKKGARDGALITGGAIVIKIVIDIFTGGWLFG